MYNSVSELPTQVLNALDQDDAVKWMEAYNALDPKDEDGVRTAKRKAWESVRTLPSSFSFDIVATVEDVDSDGELITLDTVKSLMDGYISRGGVIQDMHGNYNVGVIHGWDDYTDPETGYPGILVHGNVFGGSGTNQEYIKARQDFIDGKNSLSIGGDATIEGYECDESRCFVRRNMEELMEISLCTVPANPYAKLVWYNDKAVVKSDDGLSLKVNDIHVHKSYNECRFEADRKEVEAFMKANGIKGSCRVARDGCRVSFASDSDEVSFLLKSDGYMSFDRDTGEFIVGSVEHRMESAFKDALRKGDITPDGRVLPSMTIGTFRDLASDGFIRKRGCDWWFDPSLLKEAGAVTFGTPGAVNASFSDVDDDCGCPKANRRIGFESLIRWREDNR